MFLGKALYPTLIANASILFCLMIKNNPFQNSNKRSAVATLLTFLFDKGTWMKTDNQECCHFTVWVAHTKLQSCHCEEPFDPAHGPEHAEGAKATWQSIIVSLPWRDLAGTL